MSIIERVHEMRNQGGEALTTRLVDDVVISFAERDSRLVEAIEVAWSEFQVLREERAELLALDERSQIAYLQSDFINFYADDAVNPYVGLAGRGPWLVTLKGALSKEALTDHHGCYSFSGLPSGEYSLRLQGSETSHRISIIDHSIGEVNFE